MNLHLILFYLIKLALAVNLIDNKSQNLVRKCSVINCNDDQVIINTKQSINLQDTIRRVKSLESLELNINQQQLAEHHQPLRRKNKRRKLNFSVSETKASTSGHKTLNENLDAINRHLFNNVRTSSRSSEDNNQVNKFLLEKQLVSVNKNQHDQQHSDKHNEHHSYVHKQNNEYQINEKKEQLDYDLENSNRQKLEQAGKEALDALKSLFEIELPEEPTTFNEKFLLRIANLIQSLIEELNHIKIKLEQANCRMRLSFKNKRISSDCEPNSLKRNSKEPCNCPKSDSVIEQDINKLNQYTYQTINPNEEKTKTYFKYEEKQSVDNSKVPLSLSSLNVTTKNLNNPLNTTKNDKQAHSATKSHNNSQTNTDSQKTSTTISNLSTEQSMFKSNSTSSTANTTETSLIHSTNNNIKSNSKKETELSKQLGSAIDCFLCKHQWSKCFNVGFKCP